jgi:hypothetical protein
MHLCIKKALFFGTETGTEGRNQNQKTRKPNEITRLEERYVYNNDCIDHVPSLPCLSQR